MRTAFIAERRRAAEPRRLHWRELAWITIAARPRYDLPLQSRTGCAIQFARERWQTEFAEGRTRLPLVITGFVPEYVYGPPNRASLVPTADLPY